MRCWLDAPARQVGQIEAPILQPVGGCVNRSGRARDSFNGHDVAQTGGDVRGIERLERHAPGVRGSLYADLLQLRHEPAPGCEAEADDIHQQYVEQLLSCQVEQKWEIRVCLAIRDQRLRAVPVEVAAQTEEVFPRFQEGFLNPEEPAVDDTVEVLEKILAGVAVVGVDEDLAIGIVLAHGPCDLDVAPEAALSLHPFVAATDL